MLWYKHNAVSHDGEQLYKLTKSHPDECIGKTPSTPPRQQTTPHWDVCKMIFSVFSLPFSCSGMVYNLENLGMFGPQDSLRSDFFPAVSSWKKRFTNQTGSEALCHNTLWDPRKAETPWESEKPFSRFICTDGCRSEWIPDADKGAEKLDPLGFLVGM